jgi:hypothetical protein
MDHKERTWQTTNFPDTITLHQQKLLEMQLQAAGTVPNSISAYKEGIWTPELKNSARYAMSPHPT